jgi:hypothetical protein
MDTRKVGLLRKPAGSQAGGHDDGICPQRTPGRGVHRPGGDIQTDGGIAKDELPVQFGQCGVGTKPYPARSASGRTVGRTAPA